MVNFSGAFIFFFTTLSSKTCGIFVDETIFSEVLDNPANFDGEYPLAEAVLDNANLTLTVQSIFAHCRNGDTLWTALELDLRENLTEKLDFNTEFDLTGLLADVNLADVSVATVNATEALGAYLGLTVSSVDTAAYTAQLTNDVATVNLTALSETLEAIRVALVAFQGSEANPPGLQELIDGTADTKGEVDTADALVSTIDGKKTAHAASFAAFEPAAAALDASANNFLSSANSFNILLNQTVEELLQPNQLLDDVLAEVNTFRDSTIDAIRTTIGVCQVRWLPWCACVCVRGLYQSNLPFQTFYRCLQTSMMASLTPSAERRRPAWMPGGWPLPSWPFSHFHGSSCPTRWGHPDN